jgi:hypothetical protein
MIHRLHILESLALESLSGDESSYRIGKHCGTDSGCSHIRCHAHVTANGRDCTMC